MSESQKLQRFDTLVTKINAFQTRIERYLIHEPADETEINKDINLQECDSLLAFQEPNVKISNPKISQWSFMAKNELEQLLELNERNDMRKYIESQLKHLIKGVPKMVYLELMVNVIGFCKSHNFNLEKSGAALSQFHLTHLFFTSRFNISAEKVYSYFKESTFKHSLPFVPDNKKIFSATESRELVQFFHKLYMRNLPIIRFLCLPNFAFFLEYKLEPDPVLKRKKGKKKKDKKEKKGSKKGSKKDSKKGSKKGLKKGSKKGGSKKKK